MRRSLVLALLVGLSGLLACEETDNPEYTGGVNAERALYPEGPYGWEEGDRMPDWSFLDLEGHKITMQDIRANTFAATLVLLPSAEWMDAADGMRVRAARLAERDDVLVVSAVFEDASTQPAVVADAKAWQTTHAVDWDVLAEPTGQFRLAWRNDMRAAVLINLDTMHRLSPSARPGIAEILWP